MRVLVAILPGILLVSAILLLARSDAGEPVKPLPLDGKTVAARRLRFAVTDETGFQRMGKPKPGEWLDRFEEPGQTFGQYLNGRPVKAEGTRKVLVFLPVGEFSKTEKAVAAATYEFAGLWYALETRVLRKKDLPEEGWQRERRFPWQDEPVTQYKTDWFLRRTLPRRLPDDAVMLTAVTMADLYPEDSWNYVFGQASLRGRVAVYSLARYFPAFWGNKDTPAGRKKALRRSMKLVTHELGHTFSLMHCIRFECNMNGSNSLEESDSRPLPLCPACLRKLQWNRGFDVLERYRSLHAFYEKHGLTEEKRWTTARISQIEAID